MKILITGFDPFGGASINPAYEAVKLLPDQIREAEIVKIEIPTVFEKDGLVLEEAIKKHQPDVVICVGQAGGRSGMAIEKVAINLMEARIPDNDGEQPLNMPIANDGETAYFTNLPIKAMVQNMREHNIPSRVSYTAGTFVCNDLMYRLLYMIHTKYSHMKGGFIHVPYLPEQVVELSDGIPSMSAEMISEALRYGVEAILSYAEDLDVLMGETH